MLSFSLLKKLGASLFVLSTSAQASSTFDPLSNTNVALYWGQASAGSQERLSTYCQNDAADIYLISFMVAFSDADILPSLNFASACSTTFPDGLLSCPEIEEDIITCQSLGKKVMLSLGGASGAYGFKSDDAAEGFAGTLWNMFGAGSDSSVERPFGDAILDGFDFDIESNDDTGYAALATKLRSYYAEDESKEYYISAAPQCVYPDASVGDLLANADVDFAFIQFYNNYCNVGASFNWDTWYDYALNSSPNSDIRLFIGLPGGPSGAGSGYIDVDTVSSALNGIVGNTDSNLGGIMLWDASQGFTNKVSDDLNYAEAMKSLLTEAYPTTSSFSSTYSSSSSATSSSATGPASSTAAISSIEATTVGAISLESTTSAASFIKQTTSAVSSIESITSSAEATTETSSTESTESTESTLPTQSTSLSESTKLAGQTTISALSSEAVPTSETKKTTPESETFSATATSTSSTSVPPKTLVTVTKDPSSATSIVATKVTTPETEIPTTSSQTSEQQPTTLITSLKTSSSSTPTTTTSVGSSSPAATSATTYKDCSSLTGKSKAQCMNANFAAGLFNGSADSCGQEGEISCSEDGAFAICNFGKWVKMQCAAGTTCYAYNNGDVVDTGCNYENQKSSYSKRDGGMLDFFKRSVSEHRHHGH